MTTIRGRLQRSDFTLDDIVTPLGAGVEVSMAFVDGGLLEVTITPDVDEAVALAVKLRIISQDDADETIRHEIADLRAQPASEARTAALLDALARQTLAVP